MSEQPTVEARLAAHVESVLNGASFRKRDRDDLAEELYGHLWQRWQDALAAGLDEEAAAEEAIRSFGEPARLGREVTLAYHSRLYASTIGILLPTVAEPKEKPRGYWIIYFLLFTTFWVMTMVLTRTWMDGTPLRAGIGFSGTLMAYLAAGLVMFAFRRRQRWALNFARLELLLLVWWIGLFCWGNPPELPAIALGAAGGLGMAALTMSQPWRLRPLSSWRDLRLRALSNWMYERPVPRRLLVGLAAVLIVASALPVVALNIADPTQIGPADLGVGLSVACARNDAGDLRTVAVTASFVFHRTDVWPNGLMRALGGGGPADSVALAVEGSQPAGTPMVALSLTQGPTGSDTTAASPLAVDSAGQDGRALWSIPESARLQAGHRYEVTWSYAVSSGLRDLTPVTFGYDHLERFYLQATAGCGQTGSGQTVPRLTVTGP